MYINIYKQYYKKMNTDKCKSFSITCRLNEKHNEHNKYDNTQ